MTRTNCRSRFAKLVEVSIAQSPISKNNVRYSLPSEFRINFRAPFLGKQMDDDDADRQIRRLGALPVRVSVRVCGRLLKLDEFLQWTPGTVVSFDQVASEPLAICIGDRTVGEGHAVKIGMNFGLRLSRIGGTDLVENSTTSDE